MKEDFRGFEYDDTDDGTEQRSSMKVAVRIGRFANRSSCRRISALKCKKRVESVKQLR